MSSRFFLAVLMRIVRCSVALGLTGLCSLAFALQGRVYDPVSDLPLVNAIVTIGGQAAMTNEEGLFNFPEGIDSVQVRASGYVRQSVAVDSHQLKRMTLNEQGGFDITERTLQIPMQRFKVKAIYLSADSLSDPDRRESVLRLVETSDLNALVIDVKHDNGQLTLTKHADLVRSIIDRLHAEGRYAIARVAIFKDDDLIKRKPALGLIGRKGQIVRDNDGYFWADPTHPDVIAHNLSAIERAAEFGFDEIQLDYIRFPTVVDSPLMQANDRRKAVTSFVSAVRQRVLKYNVFLSADLFAYSAWDLSDTRIGQALEDWGTLVDYLCLMIYPSSFRHGIPEVPQPWNDPQKLIFDTLTRAQTKAQVPALKLRPWLQAFDDYAFDRRKINWNLIEPQIAGAEQANTSGWMLWNTRSNYSRDISRGPSVSQSDLTEHIGRIVQNEIDAKRISGAVVVIGDSRSNYVEEAWGTRWSNGEVPMTLDTIFDLASLTKPIVAGTLAMQLVERSRLSLNMRAHWVWPEFAQEGKESITLRQLLVHNSGLKPDLDLSQPWEGYETAMRMIEKTRPRSSTPNIRYSDINFEVLGEIIQRAYGKPLNQISQERLFKPLGMTDTAYLPPASLRPRIAATQEIPAGPLWGKVHDATTRRMGGVSGHAGLFSTASDLSVFARMLLGNGTLNGVRILNKETVDLMLQRQIVSNPPAQLPLSRNRGLAWDVGGRYGYGMFPAGSYGHLGFTGTMIWFHPDRDLFAVVLTARTWPDGQGDAQPLRRSILELLDR